MTILYVFQVGNKFVKVTKTLSCRLTSKIEYASYWATKKSIKSWCSTVEFAYPKAEIKEATLKLK